MGEEVRISDYDYDVGGGGYCGGGGGEDDERVLEWEAGLPNVDDLTPLSQSLISSEMLSAFSITPEPYRNMFDVNRASQNTLSNIQGKLEQQSLNKSNSLKPISDYKGVEMVVEGDEVADLTDSRKLRRIGSGGEGDCEADGGGAVEEEDDSGMGADDSSARASKRPRLVWTPQLHKRFIEVVAHLGVKNAVPKTIMQLMNVEGLSRENVASHLQKYRLYLKRMHGSVSNQAPSSSDHLFVPTPVSGGGGGGNGYSHPPAAAQMPYQPQMIQMPYPPPHMVPNSGGGGGGGGGYNHGFESNSYPYNMTMQQRDWSSYQHRVSPNDK